MKPSLRRPRSPIVIALLLSLTLVIGLFMGWLSGSVISKDKAFRSLTRKIFQEEVSGSMLTLHYSLAYPEKKHISRPSPTLGTISDDTSATYQKYEQYLRKLKDFTPSGLTRQNQITRDMLLLYYQTQLSARDYTLLDEPLSPSLGIQAQLPVLLAEYAFYDDQDIADYLNLLTSVKPYFQSILAYERRRSDAGYFMSNATLNRILEQCSTFIKDPQNNYMLDVFARKLKDYGRFSEKEQAKLNERHKEILLTSVIPAYQELMTGLNELKNTGTSSRGLSHFKGGKEYYRYLLQSQTGSYLSVEKIQQRLTSQLAEDMHTVQQMLKEQPSLLRKLTNGAEIKDFEPASALQYLNQQMQKDFPALDTTDYEIRYVHESMEDFLSPAFYLTPPLDTGRPNVIYINRAGSRSNLELFTTLSHEGFPGHLYQTVFFGKTQPDDIRYLITSGGYVEGWATYVESYGYQYAASLLSDKAAADITTLMWKNRSINLFIYSLLDTGIHYQGWNQAAAAKFLNAFGIQDEKVIAEIYQYIVETPGNYLKYYLGYLNFLDLKTSQQKKLEILLTSENSTARSWRSARCSFLFLQNICSLLPTVLHNATSSLCIKKAGMSIVLMICLLSVFLLFVISISPEKLLEFRQCPCQHLCLFFVHAIKHFHDHLLVEHPMMEICFLPLFRKRYQYNPAVLLASAALYISLLDQVIDRDRQSSHRHRYRTCHRGHILRFPDSDRFDHMHVVYGNILIF